MSAPVLRVESRADLYDAIATFEQAGAGHRVPLLRGLLNGKIAFYEVGRTTSASTLKRFFGLVEKPAILLIGDDDYSLDAGPDGWPVADRALRWARHVIVHASGATVAQYSAVVDTALDVRRLALIETSSVRAAEWVAKAKAQQHRPPVLLLLPTEGQHPVLPAVRQ